MLSKIFLRASLAAAALTFTAGSASADNFRVLITEFSFFPTISYVQPGDTLTFENNSGLSRTVQSRNGKWRISDLPDGSEATVVVEAGWKSEYLSRIKGSGGSGGNTSGGDQTEVNSDTAGPDLTNDTNALNEPGTIHGIMDFGAAPVDAVASSS